MKINTGKAVPKSGKAGGKKQMIYAELKIRRDLTERRRYDASKYLPHQNEREKARRLRNA